MTGLRKEIVNFLLEKGFIEQPTYNGIYYIYRNSCADKDGNYSSQIKLSRYNQDIEVSTGYTGAYSGNEGFDIASFKGNIDSFEDFLFIARLTKLNELIEKGENKYIFSQAVADYKG